MGYYTFMRYHIPFEKLHNTTIPVCYFFSVPSATFFFKNNTLHHTGVISCACNMRYMILRAEMRNVVLTSVLTMHC